jgi:cell division protein FtsZ
MRRAQQGLEELRKHVDTIIVIPNQNLFKIANEQTTFKESFNLSNNVLMHGVQSVTDLMVRPGIINLDFADVETVMASMGKAMMGTGESEGEGRAMKAAEMAISNPLIDDYTLKGAKGLLVNITGGEDLKLFEVDEVVNKIRSEVDVEAEVIIGAITDPSLDGKIRVSIVATSLDGQQPEAKSVINMVHRIQNRNPGYSDFSNMGPTPSFNFSTNSSSPITHGANALKLENEITSENLSESEVQEDINQANNQYHEELLKNQQAESVVENTLNDQEVSFTEEATQENESSLNNENTNNDLSEFGVDSDAPDLFNSDNETSTSNDLLSLEEDDQEDDLEIPAFLRRQKN